MNYGPNHGYSVSKLFEILSGQLQDHACHVRNQIPVTLAENAEPEPDLAVVTGTLENYTGRHPEPSEVVVAIEIADSSLNYDRTTKQRIYAAANIPVYWIVNLTDRCVEVYEQPDESAGKYLSMSTFDETEQVALVMSDASSVGATVADFLPPTTP